MGVRWLTTYVKRVQRAISSEVQLDVTRDAQGTAHDENRDDGPVFVVDGWAFIFEVWLTHFGEAIRSLDYVAYQRAVASIVQAWIASGASVIVVLDGPFLPSKWQTILARRAQLVVGNQSFMTSSAQSRTSASFQTGIGITPPFLHSATVDILRSMQQQGLPVQTVFAPTEADSLVAEIATSKTQGYALSLDSDFFVLCSRGQGCAYVPLDSLEYLVRLPASDPAASADATPSSAPDDGFEQVSNKKRRGAKRTTAATVPVVRSDNEVVARQSPPLDPDADSVLQAVRFQAYKSHDLAAHLGLPPSLLPLFAAIVGNDYSKSIQGNILHRHIASDQRITVVANLLRDEMVRIKTEAKAGATRRTPGKFAMTALQEFDDGRSDVGSSATATPTRNTPGAPARHGVASTVVPHDPVRSMVEAVVDKLLKQAEVAFGSSRFHVTTGERDLIIDNIIDSAATYSLLTQSDAPHLSSPSALFFGEAMTSLSDRYRNEKIAHPEALRKYREAYEAGHFREVLIDTMTQRVSLSLYLPEDVESPTINVTAARELRQWLYAILFEVWGMSWARKQWRLPAVDNETDEEQAEAEQQALSSTHFAPDRGYREGELPDDVISVDTESSASLDEDDNDELDDLPSRPGSAMDEREEAKEAPGVREYVRAGTLYNEQLVRIRPLIELLRHGADANVRGELEVDDSRNGEDDLPSSAPHLPASLAELLARHEASQPGVTDLLGQRRDEGRRLGQPSGSNGQPESDPTPPPVVLLPRSVRLDLYLHAHGACTPLVKALPVSLWLSAAVLRCLVSSETERLGANKRRHNWSRNEVHVAIRSMTPRDNTDAVVAPDSTSLPEVYPSTRAIHLSSQIQLTLDTSYKLAQALLLPSTSKGSVAADDERWPMPHNCFVGTTFHLGMARIDEKGAAASEDDNGDAVESSGDDETAKAFERAVLEGLEDKLGINEADLKRERKAQKVKKREAAKAAAAAGATASKQQQHDKQAQQSAGAARNAFAALLEEAD